MIEAIGRGSKKQGTQPASPVPGPARGKKLKNRSPGWRRAPGSTAYPGVGHDSWVPAYRDAQLFKWLFAQKK
jgi:hypothetical protein